MKLCKYVFITLLLAVDMLYAQPAAWELVRENFWGKIAIDPINPNIIYVYPGDPLEYGMKKSIDGGKTWINYQQGYDGLGGDVNGVLIDPTNPQRLWVYGGPFKGVARSEDGGITAVRADTGISFDHHGYSVKALAYDHQCNILYAGDNSLVPGGIYRSFDSGRRWQLVYAYGSGLMFDPTFLFVEEDSGWVYCGSTAHGIWRSKNFGLTWTLLHPAVLARLPIAFIARVPASRTLYAVGGLGKIFKSYDLGENWIGISTATMDSSELTGGLIISSLDTNYVHVGARGHGVASYRGGFFISRNDGVNWLLYHEGLPQNPLSQWNVWSLTQAFDSQYIYMAVRSPVNSLYRLSQILLTSVRGHHSSPIVSDFSLRQNYPNPFNAETQIEFSLPRKEQITLAVYNVTGKQVVILIHGHIDAGNHSVIWSGKNSKGGDVPSGIYLIRLHADQEILIRKMLLIR